MLKATLLLFAITFLVACQSTVTTNDMDVINKSVENREEIKPIVLIKAMYPKHEFESGIEGICKVKFDLMDKQYGSKPSNITPLDCPNKNFFEQCEKSLKKWLFKHTAELNTLESTNGLITTCSFKLNHT